MLETFKFITILLFILLFPVSRSLQSESISAFMADKGLEGGGGGGQQWESNYGLQCQIGSKSFLWVCSRTEALRFSPDFYWRRLKPPRAEQQPVIHGILTMTHNTRIHHGQTRTKPSNGRFSCCWCHLPAVTDVVVEVAGDGLPYVLYVLTGSSALQIRATRWFLD